MDYNNLDRELKELIIFIDGHIDSVENISATLQQRIYNLLLSEIEKFDTENGRLIAGTDFRKRILAIESKMLEILGQKNYEKVIDDFVNIFEQIEDRNIILQRSFNELEIKLKDVRPSRLLLYEQALEGLTSAVNEAYVQPVKYLLMQQVTAGLTIKESKELLDRWDKGELVLGKYTQDAKPTPNLQKYATRIARDSAYGVHRTFNNMVKDKYELTAIAYVGGLVSDSRPICEYLVNLKRPILLSEIEDLFLGKIPPQAMVYAEKPTKKSFLQGTIPNTNATNFCQYCGGYNCRHQAFAVKEK